MSESLTPDVFTKREVLGSRIYIRNRPPVSPVELLGGVEPIIAGELYKQVAANHKDLDEASIRDAFYRSLFERSHKYDQNVIRWQTLRQNALGNNQGARLTGVEGFYAGSGLSDVEIVEDIARYGAEILKNLPRGLRSDVFHTLSGEKPTFPAILWLNSEFGAMLGKYRAMRSMNREARRFRESLPEYPGSKINYFDGMKLEEFTVPVLRDEPILRACVGGDINDPSDPYGLMYRIGRIGHSLYRTVLDCIDPEAIQQLQYKPVTW